MCANLAANPVLIEKTDNNREILNLYNRMEKAIHPELSDVDWNKYRSAIEYSAAKHAGQYRKDKNKTPYIIHPLGVSFSLFKEGDIRDPDTLIAALLHDTLEDTDATFEEISRLFGKKVAATVAELTNDPNLSSEENKQRQVDHAPHLSQSAKLVKLSDRLYNVRDLNVPPPTWDQDKVLGYLNWGKKLLLALKGTNEKMEEALAEEIKWQEEKTHDPSTAYFVGELGQKWAFTSDHLPMGIEFDGNRYGSWNILATPYLHYIEKNDQGLKDSLILKLDYPSNKGLTERENRIVKQINNYFNVYAAFTLQEVTPEMYEAIKASLPSHFAVFPEAEAPQTEIMVIYNREIFELISGIDHPFQKHSGRSFTVLDLKEKTNGEKIRFIGAHLPGGPNAKQARTELTQSLLRHYDPEYTTLLMGDMNGSPAAIQNHFERSARMLHQDPVFIRVEIPYATHINTALEASFIDQIYMTKEGGKSLSSSAFSSEVESLDKLLKSFKP